MEGNGNCAQAEAAGYMDGMREKEGRPGLCSPALVYQAQGYCEVEVGKQRG